MSNEDKQILQQQILQEHYQSNHNYVKDKLKHNLNTLITHESFGGILLFFCVVAAMLVANSTFSDKYFDFQHLEIGVFIGEKEYGMSVLHIVNDIAMSVFFLMIGLEMKREILYGELAGFKKVAFPFLAAIGGMAIPIAIYLSLNSGTPSENGFGVAMSTDTAFALGAVLLLGKRIPLNLKIFLVTLAVVDDLGAILVIMLFYTQSLNMHWLVIAGILIGVLIYFNYKDTHRILAYLAIGVLLWIAIYNSGIHATVAAVILAFSIPGHSNVSDKYLLGLKNELEKINALVKEKGLDFFETNIQQRQKNIIKEWFMTIKQLLQATPNAEKRFDIEEQSKRAQLLDSIATYSTYAKSPLIQVQTFCAPLCSYLIVPIFAFINAGVKVDSSIDYSLDYIFLGTLLGLVVGKPIGILVFSYLGEKLHIAIKPNDLTYKHILATGCLAGIGFTMSIFVANLAYDNQSAINLSKISILYASSLALLLGIFLLYVTTKDNPAPILNDKNASNDE